jgi:hypothetical protein
MLTLTPKADCYDLFADAAEKSSAFRSDPKRYLLFESKQQTPFFGEELAAVSFSRITFLYSHIVTDKKSVSRVEKKNSIISL